MRFTELNEEFVSKAQRGYFYHKAEASPKWKRMAKEFEDSTPKGKKLPYHVKNAAPNDDIADRFLKTKDMPVTTANALVNLIFAVADGIPKGKREEFMKMIQDRIEMRNDPFGREKMMPGQGPYSDEERKVRDKLVSGAAGEDEGDDSLGELPGEMGEITGRLKTKNSMKSDKHAKNCACNMCRNMMPAKGGRHTKSCACNMCRNMITQDFGVGPGGGSSDSSGFSL